MHELIDRENPVCLYCQTDLSIEHSGEYIGATNGTQEVDKLTCPKCQNKFEVLATQDERGETTYHGFTFTCGDMVVSNYYKDNCFFLGGKELLYTDLLDFYLAMATAIKIPFFEVDFSDEKKLREKLKTYVIFS